MFIGQLNSVASGVTWESYSTRAGGKIPFPSEKSDYLLWSWQSTILSPIELHYSFSGGVFLSLVRLPILGKSALAAAEVFVEDESGQLRCVGARRAPQGDSFTGEAEITVGQAGWKFVIRLTPALLHIELAEPELYGAVTESPVLYPTPAFCKMEEEHLPLSALAGGISDGHPDSIFALTYLQNRLRETWELLPDPAAPPTVRISHDETITSDGYTLRISENGVQITASTRLGLLYGAERLRELITPRGIPYGEIEDRPFRQMRGFHFGFPSRKSMPFMKKLLTEILIPCHYNMLFIEFAGCMRFDSHPEISEAWVEFNTRSRRGEIPPIPHGNMDGGGELMEKNEVREFCDYARELGFELIPEVQSLGHVQYITVAHPEIAETDDSVKEEKPDTRLADQPPSTFYLHSYCPQNEASYTIIYDLIDEIVEVVRPSRFVHMGHDEVYQIGLCPRCRDIPHDVLFEKHVRAMHDYLAKKGLRMMMWADMLQPTETKYKTSPAAGRLPRDIVLLDFIWYFHFDLDLEDNLLPHGFEVMMGNLYSSHYPRYESRIRKAGMLGGEVSTWCATDEYTLAWEGKLYDLLYTAEMLWSPSYRAEAREVYAHILAAKIPAVRARIRGEKLSYGERHTRTLPDAPGRLPAALREICPDARLLPEAGLRIPMGENVSALYFAHTTLYPEKRVAWAKPLPVAVYTVRYTDGSEETVTAEYAGNIRCFRERFGVPLPDKYYRHEGYITTWLSDPVIRDKAEDGSDVTVMELRWINPRPDKTVKEVICTPTETAAAPVLCRLQSEA